MTCGARVLAQCIMPGLLDPERLEGFKREMLEQVLAGCLFREGMRHAWADA
jgi:hypothetical protein